MPALALLLLAILTAAPQPPQSGKTFEMLSVSDDGWLYQLTVEDSTAVLRDFGRPPDGFTTADVLGVVSAADAIDSLRIPITQLGQLVSAATTVEAPEDRLGVELNEETLRLEFAQGVSLWGAAASALTLLAAGGLGVGVVLTRRERRRREAEALARQRALHAREAERTRIARELHDGPLQDVHALRLLGGAEGDAAVGEEAGRIARELRAIAEGLRPPALGRFGLAAALSAHVNRVKDRHPDVAVALALDEDGTGDRALPDIVRAALFRIAQEAVTNAIEHGGARRVRIALDLPPLAADAPPDAARDPAPIVLVVTDDGAGLDGPPPDLAALADAGHFGLVGMHERAEAIGGTLSIGPGGIDGRGARVEAVVPDARRAAPARRRLTGRLATSARRIRARLLPA